MFPCYWHWLMNKHSINVVITIYNSEAFASVSLENLEDMFPQYYMHSDTDSNH